MFTLKLIQASPQKDRQIYNQRNNLILNFSTRYFTIDMAIVDVPTAYFYPPNIWLF